MILVGELASLAMEIQIEKAGGAHFTGKSNHSVTSTNMETIRAALSNHNIEAEPERLSATGSNVADAANAFVRQWELSSSSPGITGQQGSPVSTKCAPSKDGSKPQEMHNGSLDASEEAKLADLLNQWEGGEDRLDRKRVRR